MLSRHDRGDDGFSLIELIVTVAIMGVIVAGLTGVVISYLKTTTNTQSRMTESQDLQFVTAYWQRDVSSIGVRSNVYDDIDHIFPLMSSVNIGPCGSAAGTEEVITLAWSEYSSLDSDAEPDLVKVTYGTRSDGTQLELVRFRCGPEPSEVVVADNLTTTPDPVCSGGGVSNCDDQGGGVPTRITMELSISDPDGHGKTGFSETIAGERRQT